MELRSFLRTPLFVEDRATANRLIDREILEEHPFVFVHREDGIYAVSSSDLLLEPTPAARLPGRIPDEWRVTILTPDELRTRAFDALSQEATLVDDHGKLLYIRREDVLLALLSFAGDDDVAWMRTLFASIPKGLMVVDRAYRIVNHNLEASRMLRAEPSDLDRTKINSILEERHFHYVETTQKPLLNQIITATPAGATLLVDIAPLVVNHDMTGFAVVLQDLPTVESMAMELLSVKRINEDLETILSTIYDEIIVVDTSGQLLRASQHYIESQWQEPPSALIGKNILGLKADDDVVCRTIREVSRTRQKSSLMQNGDTPLLVVGNPIFSGAQGLERIVIASRDLTEVTRLRRELEKTKRQGESYRKQLEVLLERAAKSGYPGIVYASAAMEEVMEEVQRVAPFSTTVLIIGESGVGKEVIAHLIHTSSERRDRPMIKINCGAIPENLLESELFGYERGAFTGANQQGKTGLFIKAHQGTLFLDEISELPLPLQVKLLRAIQDQEVYPLGATAPVRFDARIIAASNRNLTQLVEEGKFRRDLFYRINVYPIDIPPLRERREDIAALANTFLAQFNRAYGRNLRLSNPSMDLLEAYPFPGNVRELQNLVQRVAIRADSDVVDMSSVERILMDIGPSATGGNRRIRQVVPLAKALQQVEDELILLAMDRYQSTTRAAVALGVNQSTVSRKYREIMQRKQLAEVNR